jgi:[acyl-carrier-protein] S-malonyltransferase
MADALRSTDPGLVDRHLRIAEQASGLPIARICAEGPIEELTRTEVSQPAILAVSLALYEVARELWPAPSFAAGHSLGEYAAAVAAGALGAEDAMSLVVARSRLMAAVQAQAPGAMAAIVGAPAQAVAAWCDDAALLAPVAIANFNAPTQTVVSGAREGVARVCALAGESGARAITLPVGGAFHSPAMDAVRAGLAEATAAVAWRDPAVPLATNAVGRLLSSAQDVRAALIEQVSAPVRWVDCVRALAAAGATDAVELGPGRVLTGLMRAIEPGIRAVAGDSRAKVEASAPPR